MSDVDIGQFEYQAKYVRYLSTQQRVSDWVRGSGSQSQPFKKPSGFRHITRSLPAHGSRPSSRQYKDASFTASTPRVHHQVRILDSESKKIPPTIALVISASLVCMILPSLLTISAFVLLLTYVGSLEVHVRLAIILNSRS